MECKEGREGKGVQAHGLLGSKLGLVWLFEYSPKVITDLLTFDLSRSVTNTTMDLLLVLYLAMEHVCSS